MCAAYFSSPAPWPIPRRCLTNRVRQTGRTLARIDTPTRVTASSTRGVRARLRMVIGALLALLLLVGDLVAIAPAAKATTQKATDLPPLRSTPAPRLSPQVPTGDFSNPPPESGRPESHQSHFDPTRSTGVDADTTPTKRVFQNPDGTRTAKV